MRPTTRSSRPVELWGGIECTLARIGHRCFDQLERSGHRSRPDDLDLIADLGITALRYPVLWEHVAHDGDLTRADWSFTDERLERLRELGVRPIVGLLHHGNGPSDTDLLDPDFPQRFAGYAAAVAERYPWVDAYIPVNEPLTTARFCGLYGFWHPHRTDRASMARILHHQLWGSVLAMRAIREFAPAADFIQNEDIGKVHASPTLAYEADLQNERRWLTFDLLCGRVDPSHAMWSTLTEGVSADELDAYRADPFPPDIVGFDHYVTSERLLDEALDPYPSRYRAENGTHVYADVEAVWSLSEGPAGIESLLEEAWQRYRLPIALTEVHLGGTRDEQIRWLVESYEAAVSLRARGADVRAVTVWALLGMFDWNSLMLDPAGFYESGVFDIRSGRPRPTALAGVVEALASGRSYAHPILSVPGWWRRPDRLIFRREAAPAPEAPDLDEVRTTPGTIAPERADLHSTLGSVPHRGGPLLALVTNGGALADAFRTACAGRGLAVEEVEVGPDADAADVAASVTNVGAWAVIDTLGFAPPSGTAFEDDLLSMSSHDRTADAVVEMHRAVASATARGGIPLLVASSWTVFSGRDDLPRLEVDVPDGSSPLGLGWRRAEAAIAREGAAALIVRPGPLLGSRLVPVQSFRPGAGRAGTPVVAPAYAPDVANAALDLLIDGERGVWHLMNPGLTSVPYGASLRSSCILGTSRALLLPSLDDAVARAAESPGLAAHLLTTTPASATTQDASA